ncbi:unnamed protein product [Adineta steineri]|uniref:LamG-like jellyroll fold domain-containing protein n=1 Tax=Adineta steineri TaxID=433720 RepID=A0A815L135_9BILA|nr:unnamed protein product [Adineta steineri]
MENNAVDIISGLNGEGVNSPTYEAPGIPGTGYALKLIRDSHRYITIPTFKSFVNTSFTVEMWIYPTTLNDGNYYGLFTQYDTESPGRSLQMMIRGLQLTLDFYADGVTGTTSLTTYTWYHVAFVYDYPSKTQTIYLNGYQDASRISDQPYLGTSGSINIGILIDQVSLTMAAKSADDILNDATLASWHSFDSEITYDSGPHKLQGTAVDVILVPGKVGQGLNFNLDSSYYQIPGYVLLAIEDSSFSMSLWVQRTSTGEGTLVHYSTETDGDGWCTVPIGFSSTGNIIATAWAPDNQVTGPVLSINTWTHIATTYSPTTGLILYVNGTSVGGTGVQSNAASWIVVILTLGNSLSGGECSSQSIATGTFSGYLDEFRVYSRELSATEIYALTKDKTCFDGIMDGDETDIDCGGSCFKCAVGQNCILTIDCNNVLCTNDICANATCNDGLKNNGETDVECGGSNCLPCGNGKACSADDDCDSKNCRCGTCIDKICSDGIIDGNETDIDCGGSCPACAAYQMCKVDQDCSTASNNISCFNGSCELCTLSSQSIWSQTAITIFGSQDGTSGSSLSLLNNPIGMYYDGPNNSLIVSDYVNHRILQFSINYPPSVATVIAGSNGEGCDMNQFTTAVGVALDSSGQLYVSDAGCHRLVRFPLSSNSTISATFLGYINTPELLFINELTDDIYVVSYGDNAVYKFVGGNGSPVVAAGGNGNGNASNQLAGPNGVYYDYLYTHALYVADAGNHRVMKFPSDSTSATYGTVVAGGNGAGSGANQLNNPRSILVDSQGTLYISDGGWMYEFENSNNLSI